MDKELREYAKMLHDWLYAEFYDEHRTCQPPPLPPPLPPVHNQKFFDINSLIKRDITVIIKIKGDNKK